MQRYIQQLIEDLNIAESNPIKDLDSGNDYEGFEQMMLKIENYERLDLTQVLGISFEELPPPERLSVEQTQKLMVALLNAMAAQGTNVSFPGSGIPVGLAYGELRKYLKEGLSSMSGWNIDFCDGNCGDCTFLSYCETGKEIVEDNKEY